MTCALNIVEDGRIHSAWKVLPHGKYDGMPIVEFVPTGETEEEKNLHNWRYVDGQYIYDPLPEPEQPEPTPTDSERIAALEEQLAATKILLGVE